MSCGQKQSKIPARNMLWHNKQHFYGMQQFVKLRIYQNFSKKEISVLNTFQVGENKTIEFLDAFTNLRKVILTVRFVSRTACKFVWNNSAATGRNFVTNFTCGI
jgi:hypothetical protein